MFPKNRWKENGDMKGLLIMDCKVPIISITFYISMIFSVLGVGIQKNKLIDEVMNEDADVEFGSITEVKKAFIPQAKTKRIGLWEIFYNRVRLYYNGRVTKLGMMDLESLQIVGMNKDTVYTIPTSDFVEERSFKYKDNGGVRLGKIVSVDIQIAVVATKSYYYTDTGLEKDGREICMKSLEDFVDSGVKIPRQSAKVIFSGASRITRANTKIRAFKKNARARYGADSVTWMEGAGRDGKVRVLLLGCRPEREMKKITSATR